MSMGSHPADPGSQGRGLSCQARPPPIWCRSCTGLPKFESAELLVGTETADDAGVFPSCVPTWPSSTPWTSLTPIVDDPLTCSARSPPTNSTERRLRHGRRARHRPSTSSASPKGKMDIEGAGRGAAGRARRPTREVKESGGGQSSAATPIIDEEIKYGLAVTGTVHDPPRPHPAQRRRT